MAVTTEPQKGRAREPRTVAIVAYEGLQSLDLTGPLEVFTGANTLLHARAREAEGQAGEARARRRAPAARGYEISLLSVDGAPVRCSSGLRITPDGDLAHAPVPLDTLIVPGGWGHPAAEQDERLIAWIAQAAATARRTVSVCTGAFLLARAGLLDGRRATTHWAFAEALASAHPGIDVDPDPIFIRDGSLWTSAGVTAGMDLALALVEEDHDREAALTIARHLVLFLRRPGSQSQFSATLGAQQPEREPLREIQRSVLEEPAGEHTVEAMAQRAHMSPRHFARAFRAETGVTPARYVERVRLEAARRLLEDTSEPVAAVAAQAGFPSAETMRRAFIRALGISPVEYRRRFQGVAHDSRAAAPKGASRARKRRQPQKHTTTRKDTSHGHRDRAVRQVHGARRGRAV
jgi:transcriptional regulator GlxA family with amidase domain